VHIKGCQIWTAIRLRDVPVLQSDFMAGRTSKGDVCSVVFLDLQWGSKGIPCLFVLFRATFEEG